MRRTLAAAAPAAALAASCSDPPSAAGAPAPSARPARAPEARPPADVIANVRVMTMWDEPTQTVHRRIGDVEYTKDGDLEKAVRDAYDVRLRKGKPDAPVTIDGDPRIPWSEVTDVVNLVKRVGTDKIEFAMGASPKRPAGRR